MGIKRLTISIRPGIWTVAEFKDKLAPLIAYIKEKSPYKYVFAYENNKNDDEKHFHASFQDWVNQGPAYYEKSFADILNWRVVWSNAKVCLGTTGKNTGLYVNSFKKGKEVEFVGYQFKEAEDCDLEYKGYDKDESLQAYQQGLEDAKVGWYSVYEFMLTEYESGTIKNPTDLCRDIYLRRAARSAVHKYKDKCGVRMIMDIKKFIKENH